MHQLFCCLVDGETTLKTENQEYISPVCVYAIAKSVRKSEVSIQ